MVNIEARHVIGALALAARVYIVTPIDEVCLALAPVLSHSQEVQGILPEHGIRLSRRTRKSSKTDEKGSTSRADVFNATVRSFSSAPREVFSGPKSSVPLRR